MVDAKTPGLTPRAKFALISAAVLLIPGFALVLMLPGDWTGAAMVAWFFLLIYVPVTPFALRAGISNPVLRYLFGLTAVPLYVVLFFAMLHFISSDVPMFAETLSQSLASGARRAGMLHAAIALAPTTLVFAVWYAALRFADRALAPSLPRRLE